MARKSKGRGTAAAFGLLLLFAGLVGGAVLYMLSVRRPSEAVDGFARAPVGCTTTLRFTETGTFYVFEDVGPVIEVPDGGCEPTADPAQTFGFDIRGPGGPVVPRADASLSYDTDDNVGESVARIEIDVAGEYEVVVVGDDPAVVAAIGRDPDDGVDDLRQRAIVVAVIGVVLGGLLLLLAGRRSKQAAEFLSPDGPGWGPQQGGDRVMPPAEPGTRSAVNPHQPDEQVAIAGPLSDVNDLLAQPRQPKPVVAWAPPVAGHAAPEPLPVEEAGPLPVEEAEPLPVEEAEPLPVEEAEPLPVEEAEPLPVEEAEPLPVEEAEPLPVEEAEPLPVEEAEPLPVEEAELSPVEEAEPLPVEQQPVAEAVEHPIDTVTEVADDPPPGADVGEVADDDREEPID